MSTDSKFYCCVLLLFSMVVATQTGDKTFDCVLVSVLEKYSGLLEIQWRTVTVTVENCYCM